MRLVEQWNRLESGLDPRWTEVAMSLRIRDDEARSRAAALLGPAGPGLADREIRFSAARVGTAVGPEALRRLLHRIDEEGTKGTLDVVAVHGAQPGAGVVRPALAARWEAELALLPADWSDLLCELELHSSADLERAVVLAGALNLLQAGSGRPCLRFRVARTHGYGTAPAMARRCFERLDAEGIGGDVRVLQALSDSHPAHTQGPVWYLAGRAH